jgi:outer membrane protein assembly factor BamB
VRRRNLAAVALVVVAFGASSPVGSGRASVPWEGTWSTPGPALASVLALDREGSVAVGYDGDIRALDPSGAPTWRAHVDGGDVGNAPVLLPGLVVVATADRVTALERASGTVRWERRARRSRIAGGVLADGTATVLAATRQGELLLLDAGSGSTRWRVRVPGAEPSGAPYVWLSGAHAVVAWSTAGSCCEVGAVDLDDGGLTWRTSITNRSTVPVVHRGLVVVAMSARTPSSGRVVAYDAATGTIRWRTPVRGRFGTGLWGDAAGGDVVFVNDAGAVLLLDVARGRLRWTSEPVEPSDEAHPRIAGDRVFLTPLSVGAVEIDRGSGAVLQSGPFTPEVYVHFSAALPDRFEVLVGNGIESAVWAFEPPESG